MRPVEVKEALVGCASEFLNVDPEATIGNFLLWEEEQQGGGAQEEEEEGAEEHGGDGEARHGRLPNLALLASDGRSHHSLAHSVCFTYSLPLLPFFTSTTILLGLSIMKLDVDKSGDNAGAAGLLLLLVAPAVSVIGILLWLARARSNLEPAIQELHRRHGPVLTLSFLSPRPTIFVSRHVVPHRALVRCNTAFASRPPAIVPFCVLTTSQCTVSSTPCPNMWVTH